MRLPADEVLLEEYKNAFRKIAKDDVRMGFVIHLIVFVMINGLLIATNVMTYGDSYGPFRAEVIWFHYPLVGWGIGLVAHYLFGVRWIDRFISMFEARAEYGAWHKEESAE